VEQKNRLVVRKAVGYRRCDIEEKVSILNRLYEALRLYTTTFSR